MKRKGEGEKKGRVITDDRFVAAQSDPRFIQAPRKRSKVEIDSRFSHVFSDAKFASSNAAIDKRGKPKSKNERGTSLNHYYRLQNKEKDSKVLSQDEKEDERAKASESNQIVSSSESEHGSLESNDISDDSDSEEQISDQSQPSSSSDSDDDYSAEEEQDLFMQQEDVPEIENETRRLAVVNLDWGQVRADDIYVLLSSFLPNGGEIKSVSVYPSEFGVQRMKEEDLQGPVGLFGDDDDDEQDDEIKLRNYELSRLRYYYAVVECDSIATASYIYKTCDGVEFERSANKLDLRFIPDSMAFEHEPRDVAKEAPANYEGVDFQTRALQHSKIDLTWDEDELQRKKTFKRKLNEKQLAELELKEYLASDDSESDEAGNVDGTCDESTKKLDMKRAKYHALLQSGDRSDEDHQEKDQDLEVTFKFGLEDISKRILEKKDKKSETVWEASLRKRREKKMASRNKSEDSSDGSDSEEENQSDDFFVEEPAVNGAKKGKTKKKSSGGGEVVTREAEASVAELELLTADDNGQNLHVKGYKQQALKKARKGKEATDEAKIPSVDYDDPRFSSLFTSPLFALDPTDPQFKRSAAYLRQNQQLKKGKGKDMGQKDAPPDQTPVPGETMSISEGASRRPSSGKEPVEMAASVKSLKMKLKRLASRPQGTVVVKSKQR